MSASLLEVKWSAFGRHARHTCRWPAPLYIKCSICACSHTFQRPLQSTWVASAGGPCSARQRGAAGLPCRERQPRHPGASQARADKALEGYGPGVNPEALKKELLVCQRVCEVWHVENNVMRELQWYSSFPQLLEELRRKLANIRAAVHRRRTARPRTTCTHQATSARQCVRGRASKCECAAHVTAVVSQCLTARSDCHDGYGGPEQTNA